MRKILLIAVLLGLFRLFMALLLQRMAKLSNKPQHPINTLPKFISMRLPLKIISTKTETFPSAVTFVVQFTK